jgi:hypothetical protein
MKLVSFILLFSVSLLLAQGGVKDSLSTSVKRGIRALSLGGAFVALSNNADGIFYNPAGLPLVKEKEICLMTSSLYPLDAESITDKVFSYVQYDEGWGAFGCGFNQLECDFKPEKYTYDTYIISYGKKVGEVVYLGANINYLLIKSDFRDRRGMSIGGGRGLIFDLGVLWTVTSNLSLGGKIKDLRNTITYATGLKETKPLEFALGAACQVKKRGILALQIDADATFSPLNASLGGEYTWLVKKNEKLSQKLLNLKKIHLRAGVSRLLYGNEKLTGCGGVGIRWETFGVDYAFLIDNSALSKTHWFSVSFYITR